MTETLTIYTTAPAAYDGFSTREVCSDCGQDNRGLTIRKVMIEPRDLDWQMSRYASGLHGSATPDEVKRFPAIWPVVEPAPSRKAMALAAHSVAEPRPALEVDLALDDQLASLPAAILRCVNDRLGTLRRYRDEISRARDLSERFGGGRRYVDDVRLNLRAELLSTHCMLKAFRNAAPKNGVDPYRVLRALMARQDGQSRGH